MPKETKGNSSRSFCNETKLTKMKKAQL